MARQAAILAEDDGEDGSLDQLESLLTPPPAQNGQQVPQHQARAPEPEFEIIETDENLKPIDQSPAPQQEAALTEEDAGGGTYIERQRAAEAAALVSKSKQKRLKRNEGRDRTWQELEQLRQENEALKQRMSAIEPRVHQMTEGQARAQIVDVERAIANTTAAFEQAEDQLAQALTDGNHELLKKAMRSRDQAVIAGQQLKVQHQILSNNLKNSGGQGAPQTRPQEAQQQRGETASPMPISVQRNIQDFAESHDWYNPTSNDRDSKIVLMLDNEVASEGFDPSSPDYWTELEDRMREVLPHRFQEQAQAPRSQAQTRVTQQAASTERRGPMTAGTGDRAPAVKSNQVYMNDQRREALIAAGAMASDGKTITNKEKFNRLLKSYQLYDRDHGVVRQ